MYNKGYSDMKINEKEWQRLLRNKKILYKAVK